MSSLLASQFQRDGGEVLCSCGHDDLRYGRAARVQDVIESEGDGVSTFDSVALLFNTFDYFLSDMELAFDLWIPHTLSSVRESERVCESKSVRSLR